MTPHIRAAKGDFAKTVLMPGDPLRAKWVAETFLTDVKQVNDVRGMFGFTGKYNGKPVSVMGHGMGIPSIGIYSYELFKFFGVEHIVRIGSAGSYKADLPLGSVILADEAYSTSTYPVELGLPKASVYKADAGLADHFAKTAKDHKIAFTRGRTHAEDCFYSSKSPAARAQESGALCVEMEAAGLYANAHVLGKKALVLLTISDSLVDHQSMSPEARQTSFKDMVRLALEGAVTL